MTNTIEAIVKVNKVRFYNPESYFGILVCDIVELQNDYPLQPQRDYIFKGTVFEPEEDEEYLAVGVEEDDPKWGLQYKIKVFANRSAINVSSAKDKKRFLSSIFTPNQVENMYDALEDPFEAFNDSRFDLLVQIRGCAAKTAVKWMNRFNQHYSYAKMYIQLEKYDLTQNMIEKLFNQYGSAELAIKSVQDNPYKLCEISGVGWGKADKIALSGGMKPNAPERVEAYILYYLEQQAQQGYSYIPPDELMGALLENVDENISDYAVTTAIHSLFDAKKLWWDEDKTKIGLYYYYQLELNIAEELVRLNSAPSDFNIDGWEAVIKAKEQSQGWDYTEQQLEGIKTVLEKNVVAITGGAGTGKSSIVDGMIAVLKDYQSASCALAGRAASRISEITGEESFTIHRLLGFPNKSPDSKNGFKYHDEHQLEHDIIIVDEISMIGGKLFYNLLRAIKSGAKVILIGDIGQLESIGECKIAADIIQSPEIPTVFLDKIHRQAQRSAIITESQKVRHGEQLIPKEWVGEEIRGELQDLELDCYSDSSNTYYKVLQHFAKHLKDTKDILDIQVLAANKNKGDASVWSLNLAIQEIYNPPSRDKKETSVFYSMSQSCCLREGDKAINRKNHYQTINPDGNITPIYNGNIGIIREIDKYNGTMLIDFQGIGEVIVPAQFYKDIQLGYAITCHSSQGSQFKKVIVALDFVAYTLLSREWLYTALTRAMEHCTLVAQNGALRYAIGNESITRKDTHLVQLIDEVAHPKVKW